MPASFRSRAGTTSSWRASRPGPGSSRRCGASSAWRRRSGRRPGRHGGGEIEAAFDQALELAPGDRPALLGRIGGDDPELRREVESLLAYAEESGLTAKLAAAVATPGPSPLPRLALAPGGMVSQYELVERLGGGGMGVVYKAMDRRLRRFVALKFLPPSLGEERELKLRFMQEAKAIAFLDHPNLCTIHEVEEWENGQLFLVMPYYEGETLRQKIAAGPLPFAEVVDYGAQIARGLAHAHDAGVVHRDIKPANIVVTPGGRVKILDFGVAKLRDTSLTQTGAVLGTLSYMSPEQGSGEPVDHRTDLWALGVVLYEMVTGRPPFAADSREGLFYAIQYRDPVRMDGLRPGVPPALEEVVSRLLEKRPAGRYGDAHAVVTALEESLG